MNEHAAPSEVTRAHAPDPIKKRALRIVKGTASYADRFVPDQSELVALIAALRSMGCRIAFTAGVWDFYHEGHGRYIEAGKKEAYALYPDAEAVIMVVGVDTDVLTRERKGPKRPFVDEQERCTVLGQLRAVDIIAPQYAPNSLFRIVHHDVRIISATTGDLPDEAMMLAECEHLVKLPPQSQDSTTARIRRLLLEGKTDTLARVKEGLEKLLKEIEDAED